MQPVVARTFAVADVSPAATPLPEKNMATFLRGCLGGLESCSDFHASVVVPHAHVLVEAAYLAFSQHRPLVLSPDMIWLCLAQGLAAHIRLDAERWRDRFVSHPGRLTLKIQRQDFVPGSLENPWDEVIDGFSLQLHEHLRRDPFTANFSTTGRVERIASQVVLMGAMQSYFEYLCLCICGIPSLTLEGTSQDWAEIRRRFEGFREFGLDFWVDPVAPVLEQFEAASRGEVDPRFWRDIYQEHPTDRETYGGPYLTFSGWIGKFVPYLNGFQPNPLLQDPASPIYMAALPIAIARAPVESDMGELDFLAGLLAIEQDPHTLALRPKAGWAVRREERRL
ncbi:MAG: DUF4419 domain-containing protein [Candidatus Eremiobacterota bacterium]